MILKDAPFTEDQNIISKEMWRQILCIAAYQVVVLVAILVTGAFTFNIDLNYLDERIENSEFTGKGKLFTLMFYTFIFMQLFNQWISRRIGVRDFKIFFNFGRSRNLMLTQLAVFGALVVCNVFLNRLSGVAPLTQ